MLTRRQVLGVGGAGALSLLLAGCAGRLRPVDTAAEGFGQDASGTLAMWCRSETQLGTQAVVKAFEASQDRIRVDLTPVPSGQYVTKLATAIRGGRPPDLVDIDDINSTLFAYREVFADLTPLVGDLGDPDVFSPGHTRLSTIGRKQYGVPFLADDSTLWLNLELFDRAKVDPDEAVKSFDGYLDAARAIAGLGEGIYGWSAPGNAAGALGFTVQPHVWAADTDLIAGEVGDQRGRIRDNEALRSTLTLFSTMWRERLMPPRSFSDDASAWGADFLAGTIGMDPNGYGQIAPKATGGLRNALRSELFVGRTGKTAFFDGGDNLCLPNGGANPSAAWEFVRFALQVEQQQSLPESGFYPIRSDANTAAFRERFPLAVPPLNDLDAGYAPRSLSYNRLYNQQDGPWLAMYRRAVFAGDVDGALDAAQQDYDRILAQGDA